MHNSNWGTRCEIALRRMPPNPTNEKSTLVQGRNNYLSQCCRHMASLGQIKLSHLYGMTTVYLFLYSDVISFLKSSATRPFVQPCNRTTKIPQISILLTLCERHSVIIDDISSPKRHVMREALPLQCRHNECDSISKSPALRLFTESFIQAQKNIKAQRHWPLWGEFTSDRWIPRTQDSNAENVSIWWRHHAMSWRQHAIWMS